MTRQQIISANKLDNGRIVFLSPDGQWVSDFADARIVLPDSDADAALQDAKRAEAANLVVSVETVEVETSSEGLRPVKLRDRIRIFGPTTGENSVQDTAVEEHVLSGTIDPGI